MVFCLNSFIYYAQLSFKVGFLLSVKETRSILCFTGPLSPSRGCLYLYAGKVSHLSSVPCAGSHLGRPPLICTATVSSCLSGIGESLSGPHQVDTQIHLWVCGVVSSILMAFCLLFSDLGLSSFCSTSGCFDDSANESWANEQKDYGNP